MFQICELNYNKILNDKYNKNSYEDKIDSMQ